MGYYTNYALSTDANDETLASILQEKIYEGQSSLATAFDDQHKWYDHEADMLRISKVYPHVTFRLDGDGAEAGDQWRKWFRNGKCIGQIKVEMPPDPVTTPLTEVDRDTIERLDELGKEHAEFKRLAKKFGG